MNVKIYASEDTCQISIVVELYIFEYIIKYILVTHTYMFIRKVGPRDGRTLNVINQGIKFIVKFKVEIGKFSLSVECLDKSSLGNQGAKSNLEFWLSKESQ